MKQLSERAMLLLLAAVQFTHIMDFMVMMPMGPQLMRDLQIGPGKFSALVAAYTISSGIAGLLMAPFIDQYDRRKLLLFTFAGFILGTLGCALSHQDGTLMLARVVCGAFGGISGSVIMAIIGDLVPQSRRGAAMGILMTAFSLAAAFGVPFGLELAQRWSWEMPFLFLTFVSIIIWIFLFRGLPPVSGHRPSVPGSQMKSFFSLLADRNAGRGLIFMAVLVFGHFMIIPLLSPLLVANVKFPERLLFLIYFVGGVVTIFTAPIVGKLADRHGRLQILCWLAAVACVVTLSLSLAGPLPAWLVLVLTGSFFVFASGRFVPAHAILSMAVQSSRRGSFMSLVSCARDLACGLASSVGGWIVTTGPSGELRNFHWLGWLSVIAGIASLWLASHVKVNETGASLMK